MLTKNVHEIFGPLLLVKRTRSNLWLQWSGSRDEERFRGPAKVKKCNVTKRKPRGPPAGLGVCAGGVIEDDMLLFHLLHVDRREPELV